MAKNGANNKSIYIVENSVFGHVVAINRLLLITGVIIRDNHCTIILVLDGINHFL